MLAAKLGAHKAVTAAALTVGGLAGPYFGLVYLFVVGALEYSVPRPTDQQSFTAGLLVIGTTMFVSGTIVVIQVLVRKHVMGLIVVL